MNCWRAAKTLIISISFAFSSASLICSPHVWAGNLHLNWVATSDNGDGFKVERLIGGLVDTTIPVDSNTTSYVDTNLVNGLIYCYRVRAFNSAGESSPSNQACAAPQQTSISATPTTTQPGGTITASWSGIPGSTPKDWIGLYRAGAADRDFVDWVYVSCSTQPASERPAGSCPFNLPATSTFGIYELRLFFNNGFTRLATSNGFALGATVMPVASLGTSPTLTATPTTVPVVGGTVTATWSGIAIPSARDWIGVHVPGSPDANHIDWFYVSCSKNPATPQSSGSCPNVLPPNVSPGQYELRLFPNDNYRRLANSNTVTLQNPSPASSTNPTLTVSPANVPVGGTVNATWSEISSPTAADWLGLYLSGAADSNHIDWFYVSCSKNAAIPKGSGTCSYLLPANISPGEYELRLFPNDNYRRIGTSNSFTVSTPVANAGTTTLSSPDDAASTPSNERETLTGWTDYRLSLQLRSMDRNSIGVIFRYQDDRNYYRFLWNSSPKFRRLEKIENGTVTVLAKDSVGYVPRRTYAAEIVVDKSLVTVLIDGVQVFSVTDPTFSEGSIGLYSHSNRGSIFDNVVVQDLATGSVLLSSDFNGGTFTGWTIFDRGRNQGPSVWSTSNGRLIQTSKIDGTFALYTLRDWRDYHFSGLLKSMDQGSLGVMFRYQDDKNYYRFLWDGQSRSRRLEKLQNGTLTTLAEEAVPYVTGQSYELEILVQGSLIEVRLDRSPVFQVTDSSFDKGTIALYSGHNHGSVFDNIFVQDLATGFTLAHDDFDDGHFSGWSVLDSGGTAGVASAWLAETGALIQTSNIGLTNGNFGTVAIYTK